MNAGIISSVTWGRIRQSGRKAAGSFARVGDFAIVQGGEVFSLHASGMLPGTRALQSSSKHSGPAI